MTQPFLALGSEGWGRNLEGSTKILGWRLSWYGHMRAKKNMKGLNPWEAWVCLQSIISKPAHNTFAHQPACSGVPLVSVSLLNSSNVFLSQSPYALISQS